MRHRTPIVASFVVVGMVLSFAPAARAGWLDDVRSRVSDVVASAVERGAAAASATAALGARALPYASPLNVMAAVPYVESAIVTGAGAARDAAVATGSAVADAAVAGANTLAPVVVPAAEAVADGAVTVAETVVDGTIAATRAAAGVAVTVGRTIAPVVVPAAEVLADAAVTVAETVAHGTVAAAEAAAGVAVTVGRTLEPVVVPAAVAVADFSITVEETVADGTVAAAEATAGVAVTVGRTLEPVVVPAAVATADAAAVAGSAIAGTAVDAGEAVYDAGEVVVETVADGTTALALRLRDPLLDVGTAAWEAHPEGTRRGTLRFLELAGDGAEATADAGVAAATCAWDNRKLVLDVGIVGVCLYTTGGAGSLWCVALGAAVRGAESAVTQLVEDGDVSWSTTVLDAADGGLAGLAGMAGARLVGKGAWGEWLRLFGTAAANRPGSPTSPNGSARPRSSPQSRRPDTSPGPSVATCTTTSPPAHRSGGRPASPGKARAGQPASWAPTACVAGRSPALGATSVPPSWRGGAGCRAAGRPTNAPS
jgi:hypothetical protein